VKKLNNEKPYTFKCPFCNQTIQLTIQINKKAFQNQTITITVKDIAETAIPEITQNCTITDQGNHISIKPNRYLGKQNFSKIAKWIKEKLNGEYISKGKNSYFKIPKKQKIKMFNA